ncbi:amidohydrolase family protein [Ceratobasidium sp. AG-Ba]|nr:amidohydrolase family protein [Ceratobasidium sp. AG-Ba]
MAVWTPLTYIRTDNYFDSYRAEFVQGDHDIVVDTTTGLILDIRASEEQLPGGAIEINLRGLTTSWDEQVTRESLAERTIRAVTHARTTLLAGFTAVRDLGTEGTGDADIDLRKCISSPISLIPGPRYFCASRAIVSTGSYGPRNKLHPNEQGVQGVTGAQIADGNDDCMRVVRQQVGAGVDWIKVVPTDYRHRANVSQTSPQTGVKSIPLWTQSELKTMITTAHSLGVKVAMHVDAAGPAYEALEMGVDSLEHGSKYDHTVLSKLRLQGAWWCPTLSVFEDYSKGDKWDSLQKIFKYALEENAKLSHDPDEGIRIACGSDIGAFTHGENARELKLMRSLGMPANCVLQAATWNGWRCIRSMEWEGVQGEARLEEQMKNPVAMGDNEIPFGRLMRGFAADIIASRGSFQEGSSFDEAVEPDSVVFVMKGGKVYKENGRSVV